MAVAGKFNIQVGRLKPSQIVEFERGARQGGDAASECNESQGDETQDDTPADPALRGRWTSRS
jgi:hypothetical protein